MTKEEALRQVNNILTDVFPTDCYHEVEELMEALEQETHDKCTETHACVCGDAVSRERVAYILGYHADDEGGVMKAYQKIKELPSVQSMRKRGKWELLDECLNSGYYCSNCHKKVVKEGWSNTVKKIKFCPNCGSDNREDGE